CRATINGLETSRDPTPMLSPVERSMSSTLATLRHRFGPVFGRAAARLLLVALTTASTPAQSDGWRDLKIDGTSAAGFETSVGALLNGLSSERRANLEVALATQWITRAVDSGDPDHDGHFGPNDLRLLKNESVALLTAIDRGDLLAAVEER